MCKIRKLQKNYSFLTSHLMKTYMSKMSSSVKYTSYVFSKVNCIWNKQTQHSMRLFSKL